MTDIRNMIYPWHEQMMNQQQKQQKIVNNSSTERSNLLEWTNIKHNGTKKG
jgi:hypothetical protein